jgi:branched-subunit amino acid transport protein
MERREGPGLASTGNRVLLAVVIGLVVFVPTRSVVLGAVVGVVVYLLATLAGSRR